MFIQAFMFISIYLGKSIVMHFPGMLKFQFEITEGHPSAQHVQKFSF